MALLGVALVVLGKRRRREHGDESDVPAPRVATGESRFATSDVEAALQDLIAEHRAQELLATDTDGVKLGRID
ncbi:MAG: hypothetical protein M3N47_08535 [Chloroflexota bacterium]|nr:hypothetical protein [Chloroflexota bacterium]